MRRGFTLLELMITLTAALTIFGLLLGFYLSFFRIWQHEFQKQNINQQFCVLSEKIASSLANTGRLNLAVNLADLPEYQITPVKNNIYKITVSVPLGKQTYTYEHYFRGTP